MAYEKLATLIVKLAEKTANGDIHWQETAQDGLFQASIANNTIQVRLVRGSTDGNIDDVMFTIFDSTGKEIEEFTDEDIKHYPVFGVENPYEVCKNIYETAKRQSVGSEEVINSIIEELDGIIPF